MIKTSMIAVLLFSGVGLFFLYRTLAIPTRIRDWNHERRLLKEEARRKKLENDLLEEQVNNEAVKKL